MLETGLHCGQAVNRAALSAISPSALSDGSVPTAARLGVRRPSQMKTPRRGRRKRQEGPTQKLISGAGPTQPGQPSEGLCRGRRDRTQRAGPAASVGAPTPPPACYLHPLPQLGRRPSAKGASFAQRTATPTPSSPPTIRAREEGGGTARGPRKAGAPRRTAILQGEPFHLLSRKNGEEGREDPENNRVQIRREKERKAPHEVRRRKLKAGLSPDTLLHCVFFPLVSSLRPRNKAPGLGISLKRSGKEPEVFAWTFLPGFCQKCSVER